uniref:proline-, glutamic acid- and leucine-rich protein 1-like n=1 Tax=Callithrix jacchus TaxID=9483 RepID=UPI0023DD0EF2|nr:proline-, glutamic acid- and leucine-rich protein 1-like [Callithrix jacchus]
MQPKPESEPGLLSEVEDAALTHAPEVLPSQGEVERDGGSPTAGPPPQELVEEEPSAFPTLLEEGTEDGDDKVQPPTETSTEEKIETETEAEALQEKMGRRLFG